VTLSREGYALRSLLFKNEINCQNKEYRPNQVIQFEGFGFESNQGENHENDQSDHFLNDFQFDEGKRASISGEADFISRNLKHVFEKCDSPADKNDRDQSQFAKPFPLGKLQMPVPSEGHKTIGKDE